MIARSDKPSFLSVPGLCPLLPPIHPLDAWRVRQSQFPAVESARHGRLRSRRCKFIGSSGDKQLYFCSGVQLHGICQCDIHAHL